MLWTSCACDFLQQACILCCFALLSNYVSSRFIDKKHVPYLVISLPATFPQMNPARQTRPVMGGNQAAPGSQQQVRQSAATSRPITGQAGAAQRPAMPMPQSSVQGRAQPQTQNVRPPMNMFNNRPQVCNSGQWPNFADTLHIFIPLNARLFLYSKHDLQFSISLHLF